MTAAQYTCNPAPRNSHGEAPADPAGGRRHPNFLVLLTDDQGPWAVGENWPELITPVLDGLAATSTVFDNYYCASPVCSPARASLLTGYMPSAHGVHDWLVGGRHPDAWEEPFIVGAPTLPEVLRSSGYVTGMSGKWHVGTSQYPAPGFDYWYAHRYGGSVYVDAPIWGADGTEETEPRYFTDAVADEAIAMLGQMTGEGQDDPFYLQVAFTAPHSPWVDAHPRDLVGLYADTDFPSVPREEPHPWTRAYNDFASAFADPVPSLCGYAASLSGVDRAVGRILQALELSGRAQDTVIVYMSDNGFSCGHHGVWGKGNGTYPLNFWENSVRVPAWFHLPGQADQRRVNQPVSAASFFETVCALAGVQVAEDPLRAAGSAAALLTGQMDGDQPVMAFDEYGGGRMIRTDRYKFVDRYDGPAELYDLVNDPEERENLVGLSSRRAVARELQDRLHEWFSQHETDVNSAWSRDVRGRGQVHPPRSGFDDARTYVLEDMVMDGVGKA